jgi:acyl-CoA thioester hydrolase
MRTHELQLKIYLEDTDAQGIVYHANYLKYCERARTEMLGSAAGTPSPTLADWQARGYLFVVHELHVKYKVPARLHDGLVVRTELERGSSYRLMFKHKVHRLADEAAVVQIEAVVVAVGTDGGLRELPPGLFD